MKRLENFQDLETSCGKLLPAFSMSPPKTLKNFSVFEGPLDLEAPGQFAPSTPSRRPWAYCKSYSIRLLRIVFF